MAFSKHLWKYIFSIKKQELAVTVIVWVIEIYYFDELINHPLEN